MPLKAAIIGCGKIGWSFQDDPGASRFGICTHAAAWDAINDVEVVAVADASEKNARACSERWAVPHVFSSLGTLLIGTDPEIVSIATPDHCHYADVKRCLEHDSVRAVLAEKPLAPSTDEASQLAALAKQHGKHLVVNYSRRFCPFYIEFRQRFQSGEFGRLRLARNLYTKGIRHNGSHFLDLMRWWFGDIHPRSASRPRWLVPNPNDTDPGVDADFEGCDEALIAMNHLSSEDFTAFEFDLCFERARFTFVNGGDQVEEFAIQHDTPFVGYTSLQPEKTHLGAMRDYLLHAAQHLVDILLHGSQNVSPAEDSVATSECFDKLSTLLR